MAFGATEACKRDVDNMMHHISSELDKINAKLGHSFNELWDSVRKETFDDTKEEIWFRSIAKAIRFLGTDYKTIMTYMNPINKKRYKHNDRLCVVRLKK